MAGKEILNKNNRFIYYICDCGKVTEYGIYRYEDDKECEYFIDSCCGNCVAAVNVKYCPFCGKKIEVKIYL